MPFWPLKKETARRKEIRRTKAERGLSWSQRLPALIPIGQLTTAAAVAVIAAALLTVGPDPLVYKRGQYLGRPITARSEFEIANENRTVLLRAEARDSAPVYYKLDETLVDDIEGRLINSFGPATEIVVDPVSLATGAAERGLVLDDAGLNELRRLRSEGALDAYRAAVAAAGRILRNTPLVEPLDAQFRKASLYALLGDVRQNDPRRVSVAELVPGNNPDAIARTAQAAAAAFTPALRPSIAAAITAWLHEPSGAIRPLYRFDAEPTRNAAQLAEAQITEQFEVYPAGAQLADAGPLTESELELLRAEEAAYRLAGGSSVGWISDSGRALLAFAVVFGVAATFIAFRPDVRFLREQQILALCLLVAVLLVARAAYVRTGDAVYGVGAQAFAAALLAIMAPRNIQIAVGGALATLITLAVDGDVGFLVTLLAISGVFLLTLRQVRSRGTILANGVFAASAALIIGIAAGTLRGQPLPYVLWNEAAWAAALTMAAAIIVEAILSPIERLFGVSTQMTLLEWCDANKPLMRVMAGEAPGTYNHSLLVGALSEAAAEAIGANGLLCRAGAYYHDIGKINKPEYFVENQALGVNRHTKLTPAMSHLVIINHVKDGIEMAKEYGIPAALHAFIAEHHGTTVVEFFYHAANKARRPDDPEIPDSEFRYPGPKPQSRETAILMMADSVEGAVRTMPEPTPARIEEIVTKIVEKKLLDGQFDECDLNFRELALVHKALVKTLNGIYHARIVYPESENRDEDAREDSRTGEGRTAQRQAVGGGAAPRILRSAKA